MQNPSVSEVETAAEADTPALFGGDEVDMNAKHPADVPVGSYPAPSTLTRLGPEDDDDPFADDTETRLPPGTTAIDTETVTTTITPLSTATASTAKETTMPPTTE